ncbi:glycosyltransferase family 2 protein [Xanthobacter sp. TB0139]|uniref:glycosyltransferase family 2 protein n=1 Tax=Xanthobacter sp. TB0139 TaxID=3459178 RepID=UPI004039024B
MMDTEIPPHWLGAMPLNDGTWRFALPPMLRARIPRKGQVCILVVEDAGPAPRLTLEGRGGRELGYCALSGDGPCAVLLPSGTRRIILSPSSAKTGPAPKLGHYPLDKVGLKLHAFLHGSFGEPSVTQRWKAAGAAARTLRGALMALVEERNRTSPQATAAYQHYRDRYVEDFLPVPPADAAPRLSFFSAAGDLPVETLVLCAQALSRQTDCSFEWVLALPAHRTGEQEKIRTRLGTGLEARLVCATASSHTSQLQAALDATQGGVVCPLNPAGTPTRDAVAMLRDVFARHPECALAYTDEELRDADGAPLRGRFKPAFNRHLLHATGYIGALTALSRADAQHLGLDEQMEDASLFDMLLRHTQALDSARIRHVPRIAFSAPAGENAAPGFSPQQGAHAARALEQALGVPVEHSTDGRFLRPLYPVPQEAPLVSIVVPTRDRADLLGMALRTLIDKTIYRRFEIIIVDNGSVEPETFALFDAICAAWPQTQVVRDDGDFNYPRICNAGVAEAKGELILLLNNDIEVIDGNWLSEMVALAALPRTGVVGAKLLYPDHSVQHAGVIVGLFRYAGHWFAHSPEQAEGYEGRLLVRQNLSAVTGACLLIRRDVWEKTGPLDAERFAEDCNDIDLCLRARRAGFDVVFTPHTGLLHHESVSRGKKRSKAHRERLKAQRARMEEAWGTSTFVDPHYNPNLARKSLFATLAEQPEGPRDPRTDAI